MITAKEARDRVAKAIALIAFERMIEDKILAASDNGAYEVTTQLASQNQNTVMTASFANRLSKLGYVVYYPTNTCEGFRTLTISWKIS